MCEQVSRTLLGKPAALEEKQRVCIDLPDCCAMLATHIVVENFKLRLGVDARFARKQQVTAALCRIGSHRTYVYHDLAAENRMRRAIGYALVQLDTLASGCGMVDLSVRVGDLAPRYQGQPVEMHFSALPLLHDMQGMARQSCAECERGWGINTLSAQFD